MCAANSQLDNYVLKADFNTANETNDNRLSSLEYWCQKDGGKNMLNGSFTILGSLVNNELNQSLVNLSNQIKDLGANCISKDILTNIFSKSLMYNINNNRNEKDYIEFSKQYLKLA